MVFFRCWLSVYSSFTSCIRSLTWGIRAEKEVAAHQPTSASQGLGPAHTPSR